MRLRVEPPAVMLVRIAAGEEPRELALDDLFVRVLRVRHPVPACQRIRITRPHVVIFGESVRLADRALLLEEAKLVGAAVLPLSSMINRQALGAWLRNAMELVAQRRAA